MWLRGSVSLLLNPFLRVFSISAFLKVIHAPKEGVNQVLRKWTFLHSDFYILAIRASHQPYKDPISRVSCQSVEKSWEPGQSNLAIFTMLCSWYCVVNLDFRWRSPQLAWFSRLSTFRQLTLDMVVFIRTMGSPDCEDIKIIYGGSPFSCYLIHLLFLRTFKKAEMENPLGMG